MTKIITIVGDYFHDHDDILTFIKKAVSKTSEKDLTIEDLPVGSIQEAISKNPEIIILGLEDRINPLDEVVNTWFDASIEKSLVDYVKNGGHLIAWHSALASYPEQSDYIKMLKGYFISHPDYHPETRYTSIGTDFGSIDVTFVEEQYFVEVNEKETTPFLKSESVEGISLAGWYHSFGEGKVLCFCPTHTKEGYANKELQELFSNCIKYMM